MTNRDLEPDAILDPAEKLKLITYEKRKHVSLTYLFPNVSLFQAFGWWGAGKKLGRRRKIDEGKNRPTPVSPRFSFCAGRVRFNLLPTI